MNPKPLALAGGCGEAHALQPCVLLGAALYLTSFFLPAVGDGHFFAGWECAWWALALPLRGPDLGSLPMFGSSLINPLVMFYFFLLTPGEQRELRAAIAVTALSLIPFSWVAIAMMHFAIGIGHIVWVGGLVLILVPEVVQFGRGKRA